MAQLRGFATSVSILARRGPPQGDFLLDQTSGLDPAEAEPMPDSVFDQSMPENFED